MKVSPQYIFFVLYCFYHGCFRLFVDAVKVNTTLIKVKSCVNRSHQYLESGERSYRKDMTTGVTHPYDAVTK